MTRNGAGIKTAGFGAIALGLVLLAASALGFHAWQFQLAEDRVAALQVQTAAQSAQLRAIDHQAESLAGQLRAIQRQDDAIRKLLGVGAAPAARQPRQHAAVPAGTLLSATQLQARLARLARASQQRLAQVGAYDRLAQRVLNLRHVASARARMVAALPSLNPVDGSISAGFGWRVDPWPEFHQGLDLAADYGTPVHAAADGVIDSAGWDGGFGIKVDVNHENGYHTWYAHLSRLAVAPGRRVRKGDVIAFVGATGDATGPHLHYQIMLGGTAIDPSPYLAGVPARVLATLPSPERVQ